MKQTLKKITDNTINELLQNEVILPSSYFQCFDKHAKTLNIKMEEEEFDKEINLLIANEYKDINEYMTKTVNNIDKITTATKDVQEAIMNKDASSLKKIYQEMDELKKEIEDITHKIFKDSLTDSYNRKWLYNQYLDNNESFKNPGVVAILNVIDFDYITEKYGTLICDSLLIFISKFLIEKLDEEGVNYKLVKYIRGQFILFIHDEPLKSSLMIINNIKSLVSNTTLKNKAGILLKPNFKFAAASFYEKENFHDCVEILEKKLKEN